MKLCSDKPYTFVPIAFEKKVVNNGLPVHKVTFHDGKQTGRLTGVMQCVITAKNPLLVGHYQYLASTVERITDNDGLLKFPNEWGQIANDQKINNPTNSDPKSIIEPLFLLDYSQCDPIEILKIVLF